MNTESPPERGLEINLAQSLGIQGENGRTGTGGASERPRAPNPKSTDRGSDFMRRTPAFVAIPPTL